MTLATAEENRSFMLTYYLILYGILYYEYFATLHNEYRRIWLAAWSPVKIIFFLNRYLMLLESIIILIGFRLHLRTDTCQAYYIPFQTFLPVAISAAGGTLLLLRTYAIWGHARWVLLLLCPLFAAQLGVSIWLAATQVKALAFPGGIGPCMTSTHTPIMDLYCVLPLIYDLTTSVLCIWRGVALKREMGGFHSTLIANFTRHGTFYAVGTALANATNLAFMAIATKHLGLPTVASNGGLLCTVFTSIFVSRLALALKAEGARPASSAVVSAKPILPLHREGRPSADTGSRMQMRGLLSAKTDWAEGIKISETSVRRESVASKDSDDTAVDSYNDIKEGELSDKPARNFDALDNIESRLPIVTSYEHGRAGTVVLCWKPNEVVRPSTGRSLLPTSRPTTGQSDT